MHEVRQAARVAEWVGYPLTRSQQEALEALADWLRTEASVSGGIGPAEASRVWDRHICDSLSFAVAWDRPPALGLDIGTGVGLPGIPLAVLFPESTWVLLDRSQKRLDLATRASRVTGIENIEVRRADLSELRDGAFEAVSARGVMNPEHLIGPTRRLLTPGGRGAVGLSRSLDVPFRSVEGTTIEIIPPAVLDGGSSILIIDACDEAK